MKFSSAIVATALLLGSLAAVAQQPVVALTGDARPDSGVMTADLYTNNFFGFSYRVPTQWTGKAIQRSQPGQRFYQLLSALPATASASIQYMGIQAEDITAPVVKTASQFIQSSPMAAPNSAYEPLGPVKEMEIGGHHFARADYRTKPTPDDGGLTMFQTQLVTVLHNHAVTLSFTTDNQAALDQLAASACVDDLSGAAAGTNADSGRTAASGKRSGNRGGHTRSRTGEAQGHAGSHQRHGGDDILRRFSSGEVCRQHACGAAARARAGEVRTGSPDHGAAGYFQSEARAQDRDGFE